MSVEYPHTLGQSLALAARVVARVLDGESATEALLETHGKSVALRAAAHDFSFNTLRDYGVVDVLAERLLDRPIPDSLVRALVYVSLSELVSQAGDRPRATHAVVHQAVEAASLLGRVRAKGLINAILRAFLRNSSPLLAEVRGRDPGRWRHPQWWIDRLRASHPATWATILDLSNTHPPMCLRVNARRSSPEAYLASLDKAGMRARCLGGQAVLLDKPCRIDALPGFSEGVVSVQDAGAQHAAALLDVKHGMRVLDACAAPGGKTGHILELMDCDMSAIDISPERTRRIEENLARLGLRASVLSGDVRDAPRRFANSQFERILADVPCTASGVVRRHPDIRWLRRERDIDGFARMQSEIIDALWQVLAPDGKLLYATCSVFPEENGIQVQRFLERHIDAELLPVSVGDGGQIFPSPGNDGFYYALIHRKP